METRESTGYQLFTIPNTEEGRRLVKLMRDTLNRNPEYKYSLRLKGSGKNRKANGGTGAYIPLEKSEWIRVYVDGMTPDEHITNTEKSWRNFALTFPEQVRILEKKLKEKEKGYESLRKDYNIINKSLAESEYKNLSLITANAALRNKVKRLEDVEIDVNWSEVLKTLEELNKDQEALIKELRADNVNLIEENEQLKNETIEGSLKIIIEELNIKL